MLSGFNTNLQHRGVLFHVQTEDSGHANPHIISHLFHGGNILVSRKSDYREMLQSEDLLDSVRGMMEAQHKDMLRSLIRGEHDEQIVTRLGPDIFHPAPADTEPFIEEAELEAELEVEEVFAEPEPVAPVASETPKEGIARVFGESVVSQKPLDEVVLDFLVESARKRKRPPS